MMGERLVIGVDLGASNVRVGLFTASGRRLGIHFAALNAKRGADSSVIATVNAVETLLRECGWPVIAAIGAGATGPVEPRAGTVISPFAEPAWSMVPYAQPLAEHFGVPVYVENDADAAALGEWWQGAGQGISRLLAVTLGTGIGTAFILDGVIYRGFDGAHPEGGHHTIDLDGPLCYCGAHGCWESLAGGEALLEQARAAAGQEPEWLARLGVERLEDLNISAVAQAARAGVPKAAEIMAREAEYLSIGLVNLLTLFVPEMLVLSGGMMPSYDLFERQLMARIHHQSLMVPADRVKVVPAHLGYYAGVTGAAYVALTYPQQNDKFITDLGAS